MELSHSGQRVDCKKNPIEGARLALNAASGSSSKGKAWGWAYDSVTSLKFQSESDGEKLEAALKKSSTNFPNVKEGLDFLNSL